MTFKISFTKMIFYLCINPLRKYENIPHNVNTFGLLFQIGQKSS